MLMGPCAVAAVPADDEPPPQAAVAPSVRMTAAVNRVGGFIADLVQGGRIRQVRTVGHRGPERHPAAYACSRPAAGEATKPLDAGHRGRRRPVPTPSPNSPDIGGRADRRTDIGRCTWSGSRRG